MLRNRDYFAAARNGGKWLPTDLLAGGLQSLGGNQYFVKLSTAQDYSTFLRDYNFSYADGTSSVGTDLATVYAAATANRNDVVYVYSSSNTASATTHYQTTALTFSKDLTHVIGVGAPSPYSNRARIAQTSTSTGLTALVTVSADGSIFSNFSIFQGVADATSLVALKVTGTRNVFEDMHIAGIGDTTQLADGACSLMLDGASENAFRHCTIGLDTVARDGTSGTAEIIFDGTASKNHFEDCLIQAFISNAGYEHVLVEDNAGAGGLTLFKNCLFHSWSSSRGTPQDQIFSIPSPGAGLDGAQFALMDSYYSTDDGSCVWATTGVSVLRNNSVAAAASGAGGEMTIL